ncbi:hypothetical protein [Mesorhizobium sp. BR-1-1-10]|uniref:hypothetical protein n=1 Tax=Mesorhizobium sp. BR-1-1-10 TaxID=2876660 RepID=UPI001CD1530B|nr:hypothetical protein [Mesorhizobium sp. BR-1-1-10]MBZ9975499.1 hypothetical protein [Mesorhizobium sp. BR-1-1-10]
MVTLAGETKHAVEDGLNEGEHLIDGRIFVSAELAATLRGSSTVAAVQQTAWLKKWEKERDPADRRRPLYLRDDVLGSPIRRKAA